MSDIQSIAKAFVDYYYATFDRSRAEIAPLYVYYIFKNREICLCLRLKEINFKE